jgi:choline-glycine betaine transporter
MLQNLNKQVFLPSLGFIVAVIAGSLYDNDLFIEYVRAANDWILVAFGWLFNWSAFGFLLLLVLLYVSPIASIKIGGKHAVPILTKWKWFAIALCTTLATGILFWGAAEPLYHLHQPPLGLKIDPNSTEAASFAMSTLFMHWSFTPYSIYTITGLVFALSYYNLGQAFSVRSMLYPLLGQKSLGSIGTTVDMICLSALIMGMSASLGTGIYALMGGMQTLFGLAENSWTLGLIGATIVLSFIISAASGLHKGISQLSNFNAIAFLVLALVLVLLGPSSDILYYAGQGTIDYLRNFGPRSTNIGSGLGQEWMNDWTVFYLANWFAWAPVAALFLGRLSVGYTVRNFIQFNLIYPSLFTCLWMAIFGGTALHFDLESSGGLYEILNSAGEGNVLFEMIAKISYGQFINIFLLLMIFISYVTAADSNISAMSAICTKGIQPDNPEAPIGLKILWGSIIGFIAWVMITNAGVDGIKMLCVLGGFPALFIGIVVALGAIKLLVRPKMLED